MLNQCFYCCLTTAFTDLAAESPLHKNLGDSLTIPRVGSQFQDLNPTRPVSSNFWTRLDFSGPKIEPESPRLGSDTRPDAISLLLTIKKLCLYITYIVYCFFHFNVNRRRQMSDACERKQLFWWLSKILANNHIIITFYSSRRKKVNNFVNIFIWFIHLKKRQQQSRKLTKRCKIFLRK